MRSSEPERRHSSTRAVSDNDRSSAQARKCRPNRLLLAGVVERGHLEAVVEGLVGILVVEWIAVVQLRLRPVAGDLGPDGNGVLLRRAIETLGDLLAGTFL